jgi:V8-like Glu-specific endopeptidase
MGNFYRRWWLAQAVSLTWLVACSAGKEEPSVTSTKQPIIFGVDDRSNVRQHPDPRAALWGDSVALLGDVNVICPGADTGADCNYQPFLSKFVLPGGFDPNVGPLCADQRFANENAMQTEDCTAFYVGNDRFLTAAHCINTSDCGDPALGQGVLFGFSVDELGNTPNSLPRQGNFYRCQSIIQREFQPSPSQVDYALFQVTPSVTGHRPLRLRRTGKVSAGPPAEATPATPLGMIGHGLGLPMTASFNGQVRNNLNTGFFFHTIDGFPGDSGAPIINLDEGFVEGIHTGGPIPQPNFVERNAGTAQRCLAYTSCQENACPANAVNEQWSVGTRITRSQILNNVPEPPAEPDEHVMILLDQTGSMTEPGTSLTKWDDAIDAALAWVTLDSVTASLFSRSYSVWTFRNSATQTGLLKVWPTASNCSNLDASGFCVFARTAPLATPSDYLNLQADLEGLREGQRPVTGPTTPLAGSLCDALEIMRGQPALQRIILESDGGENATAALHACQGIGSDPFDDPFLNPALFQLADWGMTLDSWQSKVIRRATRLNQLIDNAVTGALTPSDAFPVGLIWDVDVHFAIIDAQAQRFAAFASTASSGSESGSGSSFSLTAARSSSSLAAAAPTNTSILPSELAFFQTLGTSSRLSKFTTYVRPAVPVVYGTNHARAGDVDDSGCVDQADLNIMTQSDVWTKRAVPPLQIAMRADLSRDGWVNFADLTVLLDNWASGCVNAVAAPNLHGIVLPNQGTCSDGLKNGRETGVDCGGLFCSHCPNGAGCNVPADCVSGICSSNICQAPPSFDVCQCQPGKCNSCSSQVAACNAVAGCSSIVSCTFANSCKFPQETCRNGQSCYQITGYAQSSAAAQAANNVISCFGGC